MEAIEASEVILAVVAAMCVVLNKRVPEITYSLGRNEKQLQSIKNEVEKL